MERFVIMVIVTQLVCVDVRKDGSTSDATKVNRVFTSQSPRLVIAFQPVIPRSVSDGGRLVFVSPLAIYLK